MNTAVETERKRVDGKKPVKLDNILFATDFSPASEAALGYALSIARHYDSKLFVAHVIRPDLYQMLPPENLTGVLEQIRHYAEQEMANLLISGRLRGIPHEILLEQGQFWSVLSGMMEKNDIDLVVVGTRGRTGVQKLLLGSVAEEIFRLSYRPVLTVGPTVSGRAPEEASLRQIILRHRLHSGSGASRGVRALLGSGTPGPPDVAARRPRRGQGFAGKCRAAAGVLYKAP